MRLTLGTVPKLSQENAVVVAASRTNKLSITLILFPRRIFSSPGHPNKKNRKLLLSKRHLCEFLLLRAAPHIKSFLPAVGVELVVFPGSFPRGDDG